MFVIFKYLSGCLSPLVFYDNNSISKWQLQGQEYNQCLKDVRWVREVIVFDNVVKFSSRYQEEFWCFHMYVVFLRWEGSQNLEASIKKLILIRENQNGIWTISRLRQRKWGKVLLCSEQWAGEKGPSGSSVCDWRGEDEGAFQERCDYVGVRAHPWHRPSGDGGLEAFVYQ